LFFFWERDGVISSEGQMTIIGYLMVPVRMYWMRKTEKELKYKNNIIFNDIVFSII